MGKGPVSRFSFEGSGFNMEVNLDKLFRITRDLVQAKLDDQSITELRKLLNQIKRLDKRIIDTVTPFYGISNKLDFPALFDDRYQTFMQYYYRKKDFDCNAVYTAFVKFIQKQQLKPGQRPSCRDRIRKRKPMTEQRIEELEQLVDEWYASDIKIKKSLEKFDDSFNNGLEKTQKLLTDKKTSDASRTLMIS